MSRPSITKFERDFTFVSYRFPKLSFVFGKKSKCWIVRGELDICDTAGVYWGSFVIRIFVPQTYPYCVPVVQEVSAVIPRNVDWHIDNNGFCCLDIDHRLLQMARKGINMSDFIAQKIYPYFANQLFRIQNDRYAGNEYAHYFEGIKQYYHEDLNLSPEQAIVFLKRLTMKSSISRNELCPCGSQKKFKQCHWNKIELLRYVGEVRLKKDLAGFERAVNSEE